MIPSLSDLRKLLTNDLVDNVTFDYNGYSCGINPLWKDKFEIWYGNDFVIVKNIDEVFSKAFFNGKALNDIWDDISIFKSDTSRKIRRRGSRIYI